MRQIISEHSQLDFELYAFAQHRFQLQLDHLSSLARHKDTRTAQPGNHSSTTPSAHRTSTSLLHNTRTAALPWRWG